MGMQDDMMSGNASNWRDFTLASSRSAAHSLVVPCHDHRIPSDEKLQTQEAEKGQEAITEVFLMFEHCSVECYEFWIPIYPC